MRVEIIKQIFILSFFVIGIVLGCKEHRSKLKVMEENRMNEFLGMSLSFESFFRVQSDTDDWNNISRITHEDIEDLISLRNKIICVPDEVDMIELEILHNEFQYEKYSGIYLIYKADYWFSRYSKLITKIYNKQK